MFKLWLLGALLSLSGEAVLAASPGSSLLTPSAPAATVAPAAKTRPRTGDNCAAYGPRFVKLEGTDTCVKVGGAASVEAGSSLRR